MACKKSVDMGSSCDSSWVISEMEFVNEKCTSTTLNNVMHYLMDQNLPWIFVAPQFFYKLCETIFFSTTINRTLFDDNLWILASSKEFYIDFEINSEKRGKQVFASRGGFKTLFEWSESHYVQILSKDD